MEGEAKAAEYLKSIGLEILDLNWRHGQRELDIVAKDKEVLVIVEVKTRTSNFIGEPEVFVNKQKQKNLIHAANDYIRLNNLSLEVRFDIVSVMVGQDKSKVNHIPNAFYPIIR
jgi:putative endonuclease